MIKKVIFISISCLFPFLLMGQNLSEIRTLFHKSVDDAEASKKLLELLADVDRNDKPILVGYKGIAYVMTGKHAFNPFTKVKYFNRGTELLELAIDRDYEDIELHFLRYGVQTNAPFFLGYSHNINSDKHFIIDGIPRLKDAYIKKIVIDYMLKSNACTNTEKEWIRTHWGNT